MTREEKREYDREYYKANRERILDRHWWKRTGLPRKQRPLFLPEMKLVKFFGIEEVNIRLSSESC